MKNCSKPGSPCGPNPLGGPASSPWSSGSFARERHDGCVLADFADCFAGCLPPFNGGWTMDPPDSSVFNGVEALLGGLVGWGIGIVTKPAPPLPADITMQFSFRELPGAPDKLYGGGVSDGDGGPHLLVGLFSDGHVTVVVGGVSGTEYTGSWTSTPGMGHRVHATISGGVPRLFVDEAEIALSVVGPFSLTYLPNVVGVGAWVPVGGGGASFGSLFVKAGIFPPNTQFCCPGQVP